MSRTIQIFACLLVVLVFSTTEGRRVRVRPSRPLVPEEEEPVAAPRAEYYAAVEPQQVVQAAVPATVSTQPKVLLLADGTVYNGLYGGSVERAGTDTVQYTRQLARPQVVAQATRQAKVKETPKEPPVQTIRNYSKVNDDGSFVFGYEAADGSFKEETRGVDCVVRGKYGYVDPDGNKREFTYVSGNPCDPNAPQEEEKDSSEESGEENVPENIPRKPLVPLRPRPATRPATTFFQQDFQTDAAADQPESQPQQVYLQPTPVRPRAPVRPVTAAPQKATSVVRVTPRPATTATPTNLPATTYRPQLLVSVTPRPNVVYTKHSTLSRPSPTPASPIAIANGLDFDAELKRFQLENNIVSTPQPVLPSTTLKSEAPTGQPIYTSELVYDPASGQYNTVVYQQLSKTPSDLTVKARLPQYIQPQPQPQPQPQRPLLRQQPSTLLQQQPSNLLQQQLFEQQKQTLFQQSADLYNQQRQQLQAQHRFQPFTPAAVQYESASTATPAVPKVVTSAQKFQTPAPTQAAVSRPVPEAQQFYYFAPQYDAQPHSLSSGQIDAFLKGHNFHF